MTIDVNGRLALILHAPSEALSAAVTILEKLERGPVDLDQGTPLIEGCAILIGCGFVHNRGSKAKIELLPNINVDRISSALRFFARGRPVRREKIRNQTAQESVD